jgi:hypothetical protein
LREVFCLVLGFREEKWTFTKVEGGNVDFFPSKSRGYRRLGERGREWRIGERVREWWIGERGRGCGQLMEKTGIWDQTVAKAGGEVKG